MCRSNRLRCDEFFERKRERERRKSREYWIAPARKFSRGDFLLQNEENSRKYNVGKVSSVGSFFYIVDAEAFERRITHEHLFPRALPRRLAKKRKRRKFSSVSDRALCNIERVNERERERTREKSAGIPARLDTYIYVSAPRRKS